MNKRKIDINQIKKNSIRGSSYRTVTVKETLLTYFKKNQAKDLDIFKVQFNDVIQDLLNQLSSLQLAYKIQHGLEQPLKFLEITSDNQFKLQAFNLKKVPTQYPLGQIVQCLNLQKDKTTDKKTLSISKNKLWHFFKNLRIIYSQFCNSVGDKYILQIYQYKKFYQNFQSQWTKNQEKGKLSSIQKIVKKVCRSLYFLGVLIQNNIFSYIETRQRKRKEDNLEVGTRSDYQRNFKALNQPLSSTHSFGSTDFLSNCAYSNFSVKLKSQKSNDDDFMQTNIDKGYSEKAQRRRLRIDYVLLKNSEIDPKNLKFKVQPKSIQKVNQDKIDQMQGTSPFEINLLSNDVQNILIEQAFKIQKFQDIWMKSGYSENPYSCYGNTNMGYNTPLNTMGYTNLNYIQPQYQNYNNYEYQIFEMKPHPQQQQQQQQQTFYYDDLQELQGMRRSFDFMNLVDTKKNNLNGLNRVQSKGYN